MIVNRLFFGLIIMMFTVIDSVAQYPIGDITVKSIDGKVGALSRFINHDDGHTTLFVFWKTCCHTNLHMIDNLLELTDEYGETEQLTVVLVSVDDTRSTDMVKPIVRMKGWSADVILDVNMELARAMSVYIPPQWVAVDNEGRPFYRRKIMEGESDVEYYFNELIDKKYN